MASKPTSKATRANTTVAALAVDRDFGRAPFRSAIRRLLTFHGQ
jgi:hypothetical protein